MANLMAKNNVVALLYPHQKRLPVMIGEMNQAERNGILASLAGFPAITVPAGFSTPTESAPIGVPVGIEFLGPPFSEPQLLQITYGFEQATHARKPPQSTPPPSTRSCSSELYFKGGRAYFRLVAARPRVSVAHLANNGLLGSNFNLPDKSASRTSRLRLLAAGERMARGDKSHGKHNR